MEKEPVKKRVILKIAEGYGTYVGEPGWTASRTLRKACQDFGLDIRLLQLGDEKETKKSIVVAVTRKESAAVPHTTSAVVEATTTEASEEPSVVSAVTINRKELFEALNVALSIAGVKSVMAILTHVLIQASGSTCTISSTNLEVSFTKEIEATVTDPVKTCVPHKVLFQEIRALPTDVRDITLTFTKGVVSINGRCSIRTADAEDFPPLPVGFTNKIRVQGMVDALGRVISAVSRDETRYVLTGCLVDLARNKVVGTDGFRLHYDGIEAEPGYPKDQLIIPAQAVKILLKARGEDMILFSDDPESRHVGFSAAGGILNARLIEGNYPDYQEVIPSPKIIVTFASAEFLNLIDGAIPLANQVVRLTVNGNLSISSATEQGQYEWQIPCEVEGEPREMTHSFNPAFLVDAIRSYPSDRVFFATPGRSHGACIINGKAVVMPVRM